MIESQRAVGPDLGIQDGGSGSSSTGKTDENESIFADVESTKNDTRERKESIPEKNFWAVLQSFDKDLQFAQNADESIDAAKNGAWDKSIFENKDDFIKHYQDEILQGEESISTKDFFANALENGFLTEKDVAGLKAIIDVNGDDNLSKDELATLIGAAYDSKEYIEEHGDEVVSQETRKGGGTIIEETTITRTHS